jgi:hypothetical protein
MGPIGYLATVTRNCHSTLRNMPKERISQTCVNTVPNKWLLATRSLNTGEPLFSEEECVDRDDLVKSACL